MNTVPRKCVTLDCVGKDWWKGDGTGGGWRVLSAGVVSILRRAVVIIAGGIGLLGGRGIVGRGGILGGRRGTIGGRVVIRIGVVHRRKDIVGRRPGLLGRRGGYRQMS